MSVQVVSWLLNTHHQFFRATLYRVFPTVVLKHKTFGNEKETLSKPRVQFIHNDNKNLAALHFVLNIPSVMLNHEEEILTKIGGDARVLKQIGVFYLNFVFIKQICSKYGYLITFISR
jgi:hypothetical protein